LSDINYITAKLKKTYHLNYLVVDYLNIIKMPGVTDSIDWKVQIARAEGLKTIARSNDIGILSPMQIDEEGKVKFAKAIEDCVDVSLLFKKTKGGNNDTLNLYTSKIRNGTDCKFSLLFNKTNLKISPLREQNNE
jgi:predicted ATP-dependent serine protease